MPVISKTTSRKDISPSADVSDELHTGEEEEIAAIDKVLYREKRRLRERITLLSERFSSLVERFESAREFSSEMDAFRRGEEAFLSRLDTIDWDREGERIAGDLEALLNEVEARPRVVLWWSDEFGSFFADTDEPSWKQNRDGKGLSIADLVRRQVDADIGGAEVSYPIIFTHEVEGNQRAVARTLGWALVMNACARVLEGRDDLEEIALRAHPQAGAREWVVTPGPIDLAKKVPSPQVFGFSLRGEFFRRLEDFPKTDRKAHWIFWMAESEQAPQEVRILREQSGAMVEVLLDRDLRRIRMVEHPTSEVVRKRKNVFVDLVSPRGEDWYFAPGADLDEALHGLLRRKIESGFRIVYQEFIEDGELEQRGKQPAGLSRGLFSR